MEYDINKFPKEGWMPASEVNGVVKASILTILKEAEHEAKLPVDLGSGYAWNFTNIHQPNIWSVHNYSNKLRWNQRQIMDIMLGLAKLHRIHYDAGRSIPVTLPTFNNHICLSDYFLRITYNCKQSDIDDYYKGLKVDEKTQESAIREDDRQREMYLKHIEHPYSVPSDLLSVEAKVFDLDPVKSVELSNKFMIRVKSYGSDFDMDLRRVPKEQLFPKYIKVPTHH